MITLVRISVSNFLDFFWVNKLKKAEFVTSKCFFFFGRLERYVPDKKYKILVPANLITIVIINIVLKNFFLRPRPNEFRLIEETGYSFPSGHAMASTAFYGLLIYIAHEKIENKILRNTICIMLGLLILLISVSRIYVGVHYTSDVIAGTCLSIAYLILITRLIKSQND